MAGDRRRASHSIDVPQQSLPIQNSRKRRPSYSQDDGVDSSQFRLDDMDECNAALVLMKLSCSPHSPHPAAWNRNLGSSPGSSNQSWSTSSGSSSPPLMDDFSMQAIQTEAARIRSVSTSDEGIVMDYSDEAPRKKKARFQCTWKGCHQYENTVQKIELHVRTAHLGPKKPRRSFDDDAGTFSDSSDHEEEFYYTEVEDDENGPTPPSPPTLSHRDMARPPHEDPDFQRQIVGNFRQGLALAQNNNGPTKHSPTAATTNSINAGPINIPTSPMSTNQQQKYSWSQQGPASPLKAQRHSPRPSTSSAPYPSPTYIHQHHYNNSPNNGIHHNNHHIQHHNHHAHLQQQHHPQSVPTITSNSVHHSPTSSTSIASLSHSAPAGSPISLAAGHTPVMHLTPPHHHHHHTTVQQQHHQQQQIHHLHQSPPQHHHHHHQQQSPQPQQQVVGSSTSSNGHQQSSPKGRTRGENKKCRKVYGMDHKDQWCTQCKWKKACSRFGD